MQTNCLHITFTPFRNESRVLKEARTLIEEQLASDVHIAALHEDGLPEVEDIGLHVHVRRVRLVSRSWPRNLMVQLLKYAEYCARVISYARRNHCNVFWIHSVGLLPLGCLLKGLFNARLIYDAHELETETYGLAGARKLAAKVVERIFISQANLVIVVSQGIQRWYEQAYNHRNVITIMNCPEYRTVQQTNLLRTDLGIGSAKKILIYQGGLIRGRGVEDLLEIFSTTRQDDVVLVLMGYGELEDMAKRYSGLHNNIYLKPAVPSDQVLDYTSSADVGISYIDNGSLNDYYCLPNKMFEYIAAGIPVIVNRAPEMAGVIEGYEIGIVLEALTPTDLFDALTKIGGYDKALFSDRINRAREALSWRQQARVLAAAIKGLS